MVGRGTRIGEMLLLKKMQENRKWVKARDKSPCSFDFRFTVMTYNILSQRHLEANLYLYHNHKKYLREQYRISRILPEIIHSRSDVICLQEVEQEIFERVIRRTLDMVGFSSLYKRRTGDKSDGCAILWRREMFDYVQFRELELKENHHRLLNRDNVALIVVLKPNHPKHRDMLLHVATTHLLYNPRRGDVKLCQTRWLLAELERMAFKGQTSGRHREYHPILLCGDFNFEPFSPLYRFVVEGQFEVDEMTPCGDSAGQKEGRGAGRVVNFQELCLHRLGISDLTMFDEQLLIKPNVDMLHQRPQKVKKHRYRERDFQVSSAKKGLVMHEEQHNREESFVDFLKLFLHQLSLANLTKFNEWLPSETSSQYENKEEDVREPHTTQCLLKKEPVVYQEYKESTNPTKQLLTLTGSTKSDEFLLEVHSPKAFRLQNGNEQQEQIEPKSPKSEKREPVFYHTMRFNSAYQYISSDYRKEIPVSSILKKQSSTVDHIFYSVSKNRDEDGYIEDQLNLLYTYSLPLASRLNLVGGLPNQVLGSDHFCLMAQFGISENCT